ncbi:MAG: fibronectin type III domain-containing protein [Armatimonadota bacterium]
MAKAMKACVLAVLCCTAILAASAVPAANDRPLIFGMNPTPMEWWGYDRMVWDPILFYRMAAAGCASARIGVNWDQIEKVRGVRDWSEVDRWVKLCLDNNIEPVILINSTPTWALPPDVDPAVSVPEARYPPAAQYTADFEQWIYDLARRFRGRARYYEFWNEANGYGWYTALLNPPSYSRADLYTPWMIRAYRSLKLADPTALMSTTGIDDGGPGHAVAMLTGIYNYGGKGHFDAVADHPYPAGGGFQPWKLDNIRQTLDSYGDTHVKVWITEFGYSMDPSAYPVYQAYLQDYFNTLKQDKYDYVRIATWHTANDFPWEPGYGLMTSNLMAKPPYNTFREYPKPSRPLFSGVEVTHLSPTSVRISYNTNIPAKGLVMFGTDTTYGRITAREQTAATFHQAVLHGLEPGTTYHFRIRAGAVEDGDSFSADHTFTTQTGAAVRIVSGPSVSLVTEDSALITWATDVPATSIVQYSLDFRYDLTAGNAEPKTAHSVKLTGLQPDTIYQFRVRSTAAGYADGVKEGRGFRTERRAGDLVNGGFEDGSAGWTFWEVYPWGAGNPVTYPGHISVYSNGGAFPPSPAAKEGSKRITLDVGYASAVGGLYQTIETPPGLYIVGGWVAAGTDGGDERIQLIAMDGPYTGGIPSGTLVANLTSASGWVWRSAPVQVTTGKLTVALRVSQFWAQGAVAGHFDGITVQRVRTAAPGALKLGDEGQVTGTDAAAVVTAVFGNNVFYAQTQDRASGIRVRTAAPHGLTVGDRATFYGVLAVENGEALLDQAGVLSAAPGEPARPLGVSVRGIGGGPAGLQPAVAGGVGVNNTGLLVRTWGRVKSVAAGQFLLEDGSGAAVRVILPAGVGAPAAGSFCAVTGISSCGYQDAILERRLLVRTGTDITVL